MPTWKKIVTESTSDNISQNAATATALESAQNISIAGEVTATAISFDGTAPVALSAVVTDGVIDVANFTPGTIVTETEGIANNDNDSTIATNAAIIDYVSAQVSASGSGTITAVQLVGGNGLDNTGTANGSSVTSGNFADTLVVVADDGISVSSDGVKADVDGTTITLTNTDGTGQIAANTQGGIDENLTNLVTGGQVYDYIDQNTSNNLGTVTSVGITPTDGLAVDSGSPVTSSGNITLGIAVNGIGIDKLQHDKVTIGSTDVTLGTTVTDIDGMTSMAGVTGNMAITNCNSIQSNGSNVSLFTSLGNHNVTIGSTNAGYGVVIAGDLTVNGTTTTVNTANVDIEDKMLKLAHANQDSDQSIDNANLGGIQLATDLLVNESYWPEFKWTKNKGGGNTNGQASGDGLAGWSISNARTATNEDHPIAIMDFGSSAPSAQYSAGIGSLFMDSTGGNLYLRTA